ncbi:hypothetical protein KCV00_g25, partial [Aureobasidium melanogenum]
MVVAAGAGVLESHAISCIFLLSPFPEFFRQGLIPFQALCPQVRNTRRSGSDLWELSQPRAHCMRLFQHSGSFDTTAQMCAHKSWVHRHADCRSQCLRVGPFMEQAWTKQLKQQSMAEIVCAKLDLESILCQTSRSRHDSCVGDENIDNIMTGLSIPTREVDLAWAMRCKCQHSCFADTRCA